MSACISRHGEYSEHTLDGEYTCQRCLVLDEDALRTELRRLRAATTTATVEDAEAAAVEARPLPDRDELARALIVAAEGEAGGGPGTLRVPMAALVGTSTPTRCSTCSGAEVTTDE